MVERLAYTPFGERRDLSGLNNLTDFISLDLYAFDNTRKTNRGYTGHEHIEELDLIHMNGRVYDPTLGRFLSADPHIQLPKSTQGYNRYAYVQNNPLKYTDPSGYFLNKLIRGVHNFMRKYGREIISLAVTIALGASGIGAFGIGFGGTFFATGGNLEASVTAGFFGVISAGFAGGVKATSFGAFGKSVLHGLSQGFVSELRGGKFKEGFLGGFASHMSHAYAQENKWLPNIDRERGANDIAVRTAFAAVVGGASAKLGGGKFKNGAWSAAFVHLFNGEVEKSKLLEKISSVRKSQKKMKTGFDGLIDAMNGNYSHNEVSNAGQVLRNRSESLSQLNEVNKVGMDQNGVIYKHANTVHDGLRSAEDIWETIDNLKHAIYDYFSPSEVSFAK